MYFVVDSWRLSQFPQEVRELLSGSYTYYEAAVAVPGHTFRQPQEGARVIETVVPGEYRWWRTESDEGSELWVDGQRLEDGDTIVLGVGPHVVELIWGGDGGTLALALDEPPSPGSDPFYGVAAMREFVGWTLR